MLHFMPAVADDELFLYELYAETRRNEFHALGWDAAQLNTFLRMQFDAQRRSYRAKYADLKKSIIYQNGERIGQISQAVSEDAIVLVDIIISHLYRNQGVGTKLLLQLQETARQQGLGVRLHVLETNPAQRLYDRLGFLVTGEHSPYVSMEWNESSYIDSPVN
ncbi:GNAT family N-acetyltransferase [Paenibacillus whitsoniae]|uniref:N-acetyltransferase n=1 Tax=Paenibacillus whitsoniae TaxID=2496558 RepID=A0A3S0ANK5_9BACL|nr:GNAT family N-acetyltransferase [Paenibacillus whitsoniae]RTE08541.1 N-acetyltransferase [Paenibacillus whitsoniae]